MNNINTIREKKGMKQTELADLLGVTQGAISQWETGLTDPSKDNLLKISDIFNCSIDDLLRDPETNNDLKGEERNG